MSFVIIHRSAYLKILVLNSTKFVVFSIFALVFFASNSKSAVDDDEEMFQSIRRSSAGKSRSSAYPGARDEQGLEVQAILPQPSRNPDGTSVVMESDDGPLVDASETD